MKAALFGLCRRILSNKEFKGFVVFVLISHVVGDILLSNETTTLATEETLKVRPDENHTTNSSQFDNTDTHVIDAFKYQQSFQNNEELVDNVSKNLGTENSKHEKITTDFIKNRSEDESLIKLNEKQTKVLQNQKVSKKVSKNVLKGENLSFLRFLKRLMKNEDSSVGSGHEMSLNNSVNSSDANALNTTESNSTNNANNSQAKKASCMEVEDLVEIVDVEIVNGTILQKLLQSNSNVTSRSTPAKCVLVYFFSPYCPFSTQGSAYVNALARSLPNIPVVGLDSIEFHSLNARYGIMGTPSLILFHNGNVAGRYNASEYATFYLEAFIHHFTDQKITSINVTSHDFKTDLPSHVIISTPYALYCAWTFLLICGACFFLNSAFYAKLTEAFLNNWREAEAQHQHND